LEQVPPTLPDIGVTRKESSRLQKIASIPESKFEEILQTADRKCGEWLAENIRHEGF
jgi:hypothetical protein